MTADDILYAPISPDPTTQVVLDQALISNVAICLGDPNALIGFSVDPRITLATYLKIAEVVETDTVINKAVSQFCKPIQTGNLRPAGALTASALFETMYRNPVGWTKVFWTCPGALTGLMQIELSNAFAICGGIPTVRLSDGNDYEWWTLGIMSKFTTQYGYYCFLVEQDARNHWNSTP